MMRTMDLDMAENFIWLNARLLDRHRYAYLFKGGDAEPVLAALRPYQNPDGGFGHALEPDGRGSGSQPLHTLSALHVLDEIGECQDPMVLRICDYLASVTATNGGVPAALPSLNRDPRAPWWSVEGDAPPGSLLPSAALAGLLHKNRIQHPWIAPATEFCWPAIGALEETHPYEVHSCVTFLDHAPDRDRAEQQADRLGRLVRERRLVALDPRAPVEPPPGYGPGEVHSAIDYALRPASLARQWFSDEEIELALDALEGAQREDGGWTFNWREWNPVTTLEWRGSVTFRALSNLRSYGRLSS